jgi:hypothetical protein
LWLAKDNRFLNPKSSYNIWSSLVYHFSQDSSLSREKIAWEGEFIFKRAIRELG